MAKIEVHYKVTYDDDLEPLRHFSDLSDDAAETLWNFFDVEEQINLEVEVISATRDGEPV